MDKIIYFDKFNKIKEKEYKKLYSFLPLSRKKQILPAIMEILDRQ